VVRGGQPPSTVSVMTTVRSGRGELPAAWEQAQAEVAQGRPGPITLPDGTAAVLISAREYQAYARPADPVDLEETAAILRSRRSRRRIVQGLRDIAGGRVHDRATVGAHLAARREQQPR